MKYILNKHIYNTDNYESNKLSFINHLSEYIDVNSYYNYINCMTDRDVSNIYNIIYTKWTKMINNKEINIKNKMVAPRGKKINTDTLNQLFNNFYNTNDKVSKMCKSIFIINIISVN
jgi:hypothetical protein